MESIQKYMENVTPQHRASPRFQSWLYSNLRRALEVDEAALAMQDAFALLGAAGEQLQTLMEIAGILVEAGQYEDEVLRQLLLAKIVKNQWDGTLEGIEEIWRAVFGDEFALRYIDHQDMSATLELTGDRPTDFLKIALFQGMIPKPAGVVLRVCLRSAATAKVTVYANSAVAFSYLGAGIL